MNQPNQGTMCWQRREDAARAKLDAKRVVRYQQPDDLDLAAEEAAEAARLSRLLPQLQDAAQREGGGGRGRRGAKGGDDDEVGLKGF
jgi:hypothetical protein